MVWLWRPTNTETEQTLLFAPELIRSFLFFLSFSLPVCVFSTIFFCLVLKPFSSTSFFVWNSNLKNSYASSIEVCVVLCWSLKPTNVQSSRSCVWRAFDNLRLHLFVEFSNSWFEEDSWFSLYIEYNKQTITSNSILEKKTLPSILSYLCLFWSYEIYVFSIFVKTFLCFSTCLQK